jgi:hypothetical protein
MRNMRDNYIRRRCVLIQNRKHQVLAKLFRNARFVSHACRFLSDLQGNSKLLICNRM